MEAPSFPAPVRMDAWQEKHRLQNMNLRSVFTAEQQITLERYYDNGMTNQSKACFQQILQCAQETKLDFSVVRTWVGNKRRKLASKVDQYDGASHSFSNHGGLLSNHTLAGGGLSNHTLAGGGLSNHRLAGSALVAGDILTAEMAAARNIQRGPHLLPPSSSFPSSSSSSSSPSSSSPLSSGNNNHNNNDVILTGIYSINSASRSRTVPKPHPSHLDSEPPAHAHSALLNQSLSSRTSSGSSSSSSLSHSRLAISLPRKPPSLSSPAGPPVGTASSREGPFSPGELRSGAGPVPHSWARQYGSAQARAWPSPPQPQPRPQFSPQSHPPTLAVRVPSSNPHPNPNPRPAPSHTLRIQQVFTLSDRGQGEGPGRGHAPDREDKQDRPRRMPGPPDAVGCLSIAMETGGEEDEWWREEELASVNCQTHQRRDGQPGAGQQSWGGGSSPFAGARPGAQQGQGAQRGAYPHTAPQASPLGAPQETRPAPAHSQAPLGLPAPWLISNSRKRTLQDRTQFSDADLLQLKRYWNGGMTSLGSVCRAKILAAASQLNVDAEIIKTWISNRRRKYRLMAIDIPPPTGGPAVFGPSSPGHESPLALSPEGEEFGTPELREDLIDGGSLCLSEDGTSDSYQREGEDGTDEHNSAPLADNVKMEIIDDYEDDDGDDDVVAADMDHMRNLLEYKHEEMQYLESELVNQKQKYQDLESFTKSLVHAVRNNDQEKQQELLANLPQSADQEWVTSPEGATQPAAMTTLSDPDEPLSAVASNDDTSLVTVNEDFPLITINEDGSSDILNKPSASEEPGDHTETSE